MGYFSFINDLPRNIYVTQIENSYRWFDNIFGKAVGNKELEILFGKKKGKVLSSVSSIDFEKLQSTAIILVGLSTSGKSTYAHEFINDHPNFYPCIFDEIEANIVIEYLKRGFMLPEEIADEYGIYRFGQILEDHKKKKHNIIIDGSWVYLNSRGALIKTLRMLGYKNLYIFSFLNMSSEEVNQRLISRAVRLAVNAQTRKFFKDELSRISNFNRIVLEKSFEEVVKESGKTIDELKATHTFKKEYSNLYHLYYVEEPERADLTMQKRFNLFTYGVDYYVELF